MTKKVADATVMKNVLKKLEVLTKSDAIIVKF
jgi:hypothetical protein